MTVREFGAEDFVHGADDLENAHSPDLVLIPSTVSNTRSLAKKRALFARIAARLTERPADVSINLVEVAPENWSFGRGLAQSVPAPND
jgi:hypothetical protein